MSLHDDRRVIACPDCQELVFGENLYRHFKKVHHRELFGDELVKILAAARKNPVGAREAEAFIERAYKSEENRPKIERTPASMRGWDSNNPGRKVSIGPLGPGKG
jgi:hypothetical protein